MQHKAHTESIGWSPVVESREYAACDWNMLHCLSCSTALEVLADSDSCNEEVS